MEFGLYLVRVRPTLPFDRLKRRGVLINFEFDRTQVLGGFPTFFRSDSRGDLDEFEELVKILEETSLR